MSGSEPEPSPPTTNSLLRRSLQSFTGESIQLAQMLTSLAALPSQVNFVASKAVPIAEERLHRHAAGESADDRAVLGRDGVEILAALRLPAPGMFCGTMRRAPGMCSPM